MIYHGDPGVNFGKCDDCGATLIAIRDDFDAVLRRMHDAGWLVLPPLKRTHYARHFCPDCRQTMARKALGAS